MYNPWTFGIVTDGSNPERLKQVIESIQSELKHYRVFDEIIVVGGNHKPDGVDIWIPFNENIKPGWITKKKNLIAQIADNDNICFMHDYVALMPKWLRGQRSCGDEWISLTNSIYNADGKRFRDWCVIYNDAWMNPPIDNSRPPEDIDGRLLEYTNHKMGRWQYYSGAYFCVKRDLMLAVPLDENRTWGQGEDVQWCRKIYELYGQKAFSFNPYSQVKLLKQKAHAPWEAYPPL